MSCFRKYCIERGRWIYAAQAKNTKLEDVSKKIGRIDAFLTPSKTSIRKQTLDKHVANFIVSDLRPFSVVENKGFRDLINAFDPWLPSRRTLQNVHIAQLHMTLREKLSKMLDKIDYCAITTDCWTSSANLGYLTVTCRFITIDFILRSTVLSTKPLLKQTNHISTSVIHVFQEWSITDEVVAIVIDNASSILKACEIMQKRNLPCLAHTLNLVMQDSLALEE